MAKKSSDLPDLEQPKSTTATSSTSSKPPKPAWYSLERIELSLKIFLPLITVVVGVFQYQCQQNSNQEREFQRRIWEKRLEAYSLIGNLSGQLIGAARADNKGKFDSLNAQFSELYWGSMPLVEDTLVSTYMRQLREEIISYREDGTPVDSLENKALRLMQTCQTSLESGRRR